MKRNDAIVPNVRFETGAAMLLAGLRKQFAPDTYADMPMLWVQFFATCDSVSNRVGNFAYGAMYSSDAAGNLDYLCAMEVSDFAGVTAEFSRMRVPDQTYAVFTHSGHKSELQKTWMYILAEWLPNSEYEDAGTPDFERYGPKFDQSTGLEDMEVWIPVRPMK